MYYSDTALAFANYFIQKANEDSIGMTPMKLLKLIYISHGWHLAVYDKPLIEEPVLAWKYGPVIPSVYREFKIYGNSNINDTGFIFNSHRQMIIPLADKNKWEFLNKVWDVYKSYTGLQLSAMTHKKNTPWDTVYNSGLGENTVIPNTLIKQHYLNKIPINQPEHHAS